MTLATIEDLVNPDKTPMLVLKVGSALLVGSDGAPRRDWLAGLAGEIAEARARGQQVVVVSSGAIALGAARLGFDKGGRASLSQAQAAAAVGQIILAGLWAELLEAQGLAAAQLLLTIEDLEDRRRYLNAAATISTLLNAGAVPVINENDSVATQEIRFGDNDRLAARVAQAARADAVALLSDIDGLYDRDPRDPGARRLDVVNGVTEAIHAMASQRSGSGMGSGGMTSKLLAAEIAERAGIALAIINGTHERPLAAAAERKCGTLFLARREDNARKAWLGGRQRMAGALVIDEGCAAALHEGASLLASGIISVEGAFARGDPVGIRDEQGKPVAQGLSEYSAQEIEAIKGARSDAQEDILGYAPRAAVIHRDHMVML